MPVQATKLQVCNSLFMKRRGGSERHTTTASDSTWAETRSTALPGLETRTKRKSSKDGRRFLFWKFMKTLHEDVALLSDTTPHFSIPLVILPVLVTKCIGCSRISTMGSLHTSCFMKVAALLCLTVREEECPAASPRNVSAKRRLTRRNRPLHVAACRPEWVNPKWPVFVGNLEPCSIRFHHNEFCCTLDIHLKSVPNLSRSICFYMQAKVWQDHTQQDKLQTWQQRDPEGASSRDTVAKARKCCTWPTRIEQSQHKHAAYCSIIIHADLWHYTVDLKTIDGKKTRLGWP